MKAKEMLKHLFESKEDQNERLLMKGYRTGIETMLPSCKRKNDLLKQAAIALKQTGTCKAIVAAIEKELNVE